MTARMVSRGRWPLMASIVAGGLSTLPVAFAGPPLTDTTANSARVIYRSATQPAQSGARPTIDVFWCSGDDKASGRALAASELAASYGTVARLGSSRAASDIGEIRTRPIDKDTFLANPDSNDAKIVQERALVRFDP